MEIVQLTRLKVFYFLFFIWWSLHLCIYLQIIITHTKLKVMEHLNKISAILTSLLLIVGCIYIELYETNYPVYFIVAFIAGGTFLINLLDLIKNK